MGGYQERKPGCCMKVGGYYPPPPSGGGCRNLSEIIGVGMGSIM